MYTNTGITLYLYLNGKYKRKYIDKVFWNERKASNVIKSGMSNADSLKIFIPYTEDIEFTPARDIIARGKIDYKINAESEKTIAESKKHLQINYEVVTISSCDKKLYGNKRMWHYELSCK